MDKQSSFQEKVLSRLYGITDTDDATQDNKDISEDDNSDDKDIPPMHMTSKKVYTVKEAPPDWTDLKKDTRTVSSDSSQTSEDTSSDDEQPTSCKRRRRRGKRLKRDPVTHNGECNKNSLSSCTGQEIQSTKDTDKASKTLTKNQKRKLKKKRRNEKLKESVESNPSKEFVYAGTGED